MKISSALYMLELSLSSSCRLSANQDALESHDLASSVRIKALGPCSIESVQATQHRDVAPLTFMRIQPRLQYLPCLILERLSSETEI